MRQRQPREKNAKHLALVRLLPCLVCGRGPSEAAHVRYGDHLRGKPPTGIGQKPDDRWCVPLCFRCHRYQHTRGERIFWEAQGIDPIAVAIELHGRLAWT
jgi:hypothetical protein